MIILGQRTFDNHETVLGYACGFIRGVMDTNEPDQEKLARITDLINDIHVAMQLENSSK